MRKIKKKVDPFMIATIVLAIIALGIIIFSQYKDNKEKININGLWLDKGGVEKLVNVSAPNQIMTICDLEQKKCVRVQRRNLD